MDLPLDDLIALGEEFDRLSEFVSIIDRAFSKLENKPRRMIDSPLKLVRFLQSVWKRRPA